MKRPLLYGLVVAGIVALAAASYGGYRVMNYIDHDPEFCMSCHLMDEAYLRWKGSPHKDVTCHVCHISDPLNNLSQVYLTVTNQRRRVEKHAEVDRAVCMQCHMSNDPRWRQVAGTAGHAVHALREGIQCVTCHAPGVHQFRPTESVCVKCHTEKQIEIDGMSRMHCLGCHEYLAPVEPGVPHMKVESTDCGRCHIAGGERPAEGATGALSASLGLMQARIGSHAKVDCRQCHRPHERPGLVVADCTTCHDGMSATHGPPARDGKAPAAACADCHLPHQKAREARTRCVSCHNEQAEAVRESHAGAPHADCLACHGSPHGSPTGIAPRPCTGCHTDVKVAQKARGEKAHGDCTACHGDHPEAKEPPDAACAACHTEEQHALGHPAADGRTCTACHDAHPKEGEKAPAVATCESCHADVKPHATKAGAKSPECKECHVQHTFKAQVDRASCERCHAEPRAVAAGARTPPEHANCASCHASGHAPRPAPESCTKSCHAEQVKGAAAPEHTQCTGCHAEGHKFTPPGNSACVRCHEPVAKTAPGEHGTKCQTCHSPHTGSHEAMPKCTSCHAGEPKQTPTGSKTHNTEPCLTCHRTHGPGDAPVTPACTKCHADSPTKGLHAVAGHQKECRECHGQHGAQPVGRDACLRCHDEQRKHPPENPRAACRGCHSFERDTPLPVPPTPRP